MAEVLTAYPGANQRPEPAPTTRPRNVAGRLELRPEPHPGDREPGHYAEPDPREYRRWFEGHDGTADAYMDLRGQRDAYSRGGPFRFMTLHCAGCGAAGTAYVRVDRRPNPETVRCRGCRAELIHSARPPATTDPRHASRAAGTKPDSAGVHPVGCGGSGPSAAAGPEALPRRGREVGSQPDPLAGRSGAGRAGGGGRAGAEGLA